MTWIMVDVEADGSCPFIYSMIQIGAVVVDDALDKKFYGTLFPIGKSYNAGALNSIGVSRQETLRYNPADETMGQFQRWVKQVGGKRPMFISDNNGFDWQFVNYYFHFYFGSNPFGHSSANLGSLYKGFVKDNFKSFRHLRKTKHTHNALEDAIGNAEAMLEMQRMGMKI